MQINRINSIDYLRGLILIIMAFDHALHAYAYNFGILCFFRDYDREQIFDMLYLFNQSMIMPVFFFTIGFYIPSQITSGWRNFWKIRIHRYFIPFCIGICIFVPLLSYPKFFIYGDSSVNFWQFYTNIYWTQKLQAGPFWVMFACVLYTGTFILMDKLFPSLTIWLSNKVISFFKQPIKYLGFFILLSAVVLTISDIIWGAFNWISVLRLFALQGSKFIINYIYFILGAAFYHSKVFSQPNLWKNIIKNRYLWILITFIVGVIYAYFSVNYLHEGAYNRAIMRAIILGEDITSIVFSPKTILVVIRTTLLGILIILQLLSLLIIMESINNRNFKKLKKVLYNVFVNCYGIFVFHDPIVVWGQYILIDYNIPNIIKIAIIFIVAVGLAWLITHYLQKIKYINKVLQFD